MLFFRLLIFLFHVFIIHFQFLIFLLSHFYDHSILFFTCTFLLYFFIIDSLFSIFHFLFSLYPQPLGHSIVFKKWGRRCAGTYVHRRDRQYVQSTHVRRCFSTYCVVSASILPYFFCLFFIYFFISSFFIYLFFTCSCYF